MNILTGSTFSSPQFLTELNCTLDNYLLGVIRQAEDRICVIDDVTKEELKLFQLLQKSQNLAAELQTLTKQHSLIGILSENRLEYIIAVFATILSGCVVTCFNPTYTEDELRLIFSITRPTVMFCSSSNYRKLKEVDKSPGCVKHIILFDNETTITESALRFSNLTKFSKRKLTATERSADDTVMIMYSSGTTGLPKGVMTTHKNWIFTLKMQREENLIEGGPTVGYLPMYHSFSMIQLLRTVVLETKMIIMRKFEEEALLRIIQEYKVQSLFIVPTIAKLLIKSTLVHSYNTTSLRHILCGGAILFQDDERKLKEKIGTSYIQQAYGMTETMFITIKTKNNAKFGTCGCLIPGVQAKIVDPETNKNLGIRERGEICTKGPHIMKGYYCNAKATSEIIDKDGWLHTGDVGYYDEDGDFFVVDRLKELIKYKAHQVAPTELEALLLQHEDVEDVGIIGIPDSLAGEIPKAFVVKKPGSTISENELMEYVAKRVSFSKKLRGGITFVEEIPKNGSGKVIRRKLKERYASVRSKL